MHLLVIFSSSREVEGNLLTTAVIYSVVKKLWQYFLGLAESFGAGNVIKKTTGKEIDN